MSAVSTYAEALFAAAEERGELEEVLEELQEFTALVRENDELREFFYSPQINERERRQAIDALTEGLKTSTRNFLKVLSDNGRTESLEDIVRRYEGLVEEHFRRVEVELTTAVELSDSLESKVKERLGEILEGREVILQTNVNPDLLGGAVFTFGGVMVDSSVRGRLDGLRETMVERGVV
ncbi:MAG: ATP synthase F1 subunit delta [Rubrobacteraceae bacterium]